MARLKPAQAFSALSGSTSPRGILGSLYGSGKRGGAINSAAAAKALGVSRSTVTRWANGTSKPSKANAQKLATARSNALRSQQGRRQIAQNFQNTRPAGSPPLHIHLSGYQGPLTYTDRRRDTTFVLDNPDELFAAWESNGTEGLLSSLESNSLDGYGVDEWNFEKLDGLSFSWGSSR